MPLTICELVMTTPNRYFFISMTCLSNVTSCMPCVASGCYWGQPVSGSTLCVPTKVSLVGQLWRTIVPPLAEDACPSIPTTTTIRPETESSPVCWIFLGKFLARVMAYLHTYLSGPSVRIRQLQNAIFWGNLNGDGCILKMLINFGEIFIA